MNIKRYALECFSVLSRGVNVARGGTADVTFSAASHLEGLWTEPVIDWFARLLVRETGHCYNAMVDEVNRAQAVIDAYNNM